MITIKGRLMTYGEVWFDEQPPAHPEVDILTYRLRQAPVPGKPWDSFLSLVSDLTLDEQALMASFGGTNRYKIKRADAKDALTAEFIRAPRAELGHFFEFYDSFAQQKMLSAAYQRGVVAACDAGQLVLTAARRSGERIVWHAYIVSPSRAALLHSASHFRGKDNAERAVVGRANRWLHWCDMLEFKRMGLGVYDWGGIFEDETVPEHASINNFKREFGGSPHQAYNCVTPVTIRGRAYLAARSALDAVRHRPA